MAEGRDRVSDRGKRQQKKWWERNKGEEKEGRDRGDKSDVRDIQRIGR